MEIAEYNDWLSANSILDGGYCLNSEQKQHCKGVINSYLNNEKVSETSLEFVRDFDSDNFEKKEDNE